MTNQDLTTLRVGDQVRLNRNGDTYTVTSIKPKGVFVDKQSKGGCVPEEFFLAQEIEKR